MTTSMVGKKVLVVEDDGGVTRLLVRVLAHMGLEPTLAATGDAGVAALETPGGFDLVLTDKNLPGVNGVEVARRARARLPSSCIVMISGFATSASAHQLHGVIDAYIQKPFHIEEFEQKIRMLTQRRETRPRIEPTPRAAVHRSAALLMAPGQERIRLRRVFVALGADVVELPDLEAVSRLPDDTLLVVDDASCSHETLLAIWSRQSRTPAFRVALVSKRDSLRSSVNAVSLGASSLLPPDSPEDELARAAASALRGGVLDTWDPAKVAQPGAMRRA